MKFGDLIKRDVCIKMSMVSFGSPQKNLEVFRFVRSMRPFQEYFEVEMGKLLQKYGTSCGDGRYSVSGEENVKNYRMELATLCDMDMDSLDIEFYSPNLTIDDFNEASCTYPEDKQLWLSANDIEAIINFTEKLKKEIKTKKG